MPAEQPRASNTTARLSLVIPLFNEERGIPHLLERIEPVLAATELDFELIAVDDGSTDATFAAIATAHARNERIKGVALSRNFGKEIAVAAGLRHATGDAVIIMDGDLQHPPELIPELIAKWREGYDVVFAERTDRNTDGRIRRHLARLYYRAFRSLSGTRLHHNAGDFRLLSRRAVDAVNRIGERARFNKGLFAWIGFKSVGVPFTVAEREGEPGSRWHMRRLWHFALDGIASFTTIPLRIWSYLGLMISLIALVFGFFIIAKTLIVGEPVAGYPTLIVSILFLGGIQLISLGVIGEYLGRVYDEVKARPLYLVGDTVGIAPVEPTALPPLASNPAPTREGHP
ncbi:MAG: glycosyltransferase family 2 protein [Hyphomicrobiaceae bacterium]|nr:glycosyltransferase family 2 protein [Hyphomicrobiaceae bacterium]